VVLPPRRRRQVCGRQVGPTGRGQVTYSASDGDKKARSPGRARRKPLKPLRAGTSGDSGVLVVTRVLSTNTKCTRDRGCNGHPAFPTPSLGGRFSNPSGASRREDKVVRETIATSLRAKLSNPSRRVKERMDCFVASLLAMTVLRLNRRGLFENLNQTLLSVKSRDTPPAPACCQPIPRWCRA
jgi:hypothetical protein